MKHISLTDTFVEEMEDEIKREAEEMGSLKGSIEDGDGNFAGLAGEYILKELVSSIERDPTYNHDLVMGDITIDVKTKRRSVKPKPYYECSIADYNTSQTCDFYYFISINYDYEDVYLLGYLPRDEYYDKATFHEEGDVDPDNGFVFKADCWNVAISELKQLDCVERVDTPKNL